MKMQKYYYCFQIDSLTAVSQLISLAHLADGTRYINSPVKVLIHSEMMSSCNRSLLRPHAVCIAPHQVRRPAGTHPDH